MHTCAVVAQGGAVKCWGHNARGQLGDGTTTRRTTPTLVPGLSGVVAVVGGFWHSCALLATGQVKCWGENLSGQLGDGTTTSRLVPTLVTGIVDAVELAAGSEHTCVRLASGQIRCWGENGSGAIGDGTRANRSLPTPVAGLTAATGIAAGYGRSCAVLGDGTVRCWGTVGTSSSTAPVAVAGLVGVVRIDGGGDRTCALRDTGLVQCWNGTTLSTVSITGWVGNTPSSWPRAAGTHAPFCLPLARSSAGVRTTSGSSASAARRTESSPATVGGLSERAASGGWLPSHVCPRRQRGALLGSEHGRTARERDDQPPVEPQRRQPHRRGRSRAGATTTACSLPEARSSAGVTMVSGRSETAAPPIALRPSRCLASLA